MKIDDRYNIIGGKHRAEARYYMILNRINHTDREKNKCYENIEMNIDKDEFVKWFMENDFEGSSVDRIDSTKGYTMDNIQLIPLDENIRKDKVKAKGGYCECWRCQEIKPIELFAVDKSKKNGHRTICKKCDSMRKHKTDGGTNCDS